VSKILTEISKLQSVYRREYQICPNFVICGESIFREIHQEVKELSKEQMCAEELPDKLYSGFLKTYPSDLMVIFFSSLESNQFCLGYMESHFYFQEDGKYDS